MNAVKALIGHLNYTRNLHLNNRKFKVPIIYNMGHLNLKIKHDWFGDIVKASGLSQTDLFIDVGANVGQTLLKFRSLSTANYLGFEPNSACVFYIQQLIRQNKIPNAQIMPCGLASTPGILKFFQKSASDSAATMISDLRPSFYVEDEVNVIPVFRFDDLNIEKGKISLVKVDVEGAELEVLEGMRRSLDQFKPIIVCEILDAHSKESLSVMQERASKLITLIKSLGYRIFRIRRHSGHTECEETEFVTLRQWTQDSWDLNDYLFVGTDHIASFLEKLRGIR